jgi:hypothetical protein
MPLFTEHTLHKGDGDRDLAIVWLGGTIGCQETPDGLVPNEDAFRCVVREAMAYVHNDVHERLRLLTLFVAEQPIDSADAGFGHFEQGVQYLRDTAKERNPYGMITLSGTDTFEDWQAAVYQGMPNDGETAIVGTCAMRHFQRAPTDAVIATHHSIELALHDDMRVQTNDGPRGRVASVVNGANVAYPSAALHKARKELFHPFDSGMRALAKRDLSFRSRVKRARRSVGEGKFLFSEADFWKEQDQWTIAAPRPWHFAQGDGKKPFLLLDGIRQEALVPGAVRRFIAFH